MDLTAVDLFSGGGGASLGLTRIDDVTLRAAADINDEARKYYNKNLPINAADIDLTDEDAFGELCVGYALTKDEIDLIIGCPPCQRFSSLQDTTPPLDEGPKDTRLNAFISFVLKASPRIVIFENVPGILTRGNQEYVEELKDYLNKAGYGFKLDLFNTANFGVPQQRERTIGFGIKDVKKEKITLPEPTHAPPQEAKNNGKQPWVTVEDAIGDLPPLEAGESYDGDKYTHHYARNHRSDTIERIKKIPLDGGSRSALPEEEQLDCHQRLDQSGAGNSYGRMAWEEPGPTLTTKCATPSSGRFIHPEEHRGITPREAARIMTFPDSYDLPDNIGDATDLIGNAVPPRFIENIVEEFLNRHSHLL